MVTNYIDIAISDYEKATKKRLGLFLVDVYNFFNKDYNNIVNWYNGRSKTPNVDSFKKLYDLTDQCQDYINTFYIRRDQIFQKEYHWELLYNLEDVYCKLQTTSNLSKLLRSVITKNNFSNTVEIDYTTKMYDTLESVQKNVLGSSNSDNDWWDTALKNDLSEADYDSDGGNELKLKTNIKTVDSLESVVDNPIGDKQYGLDICRVFEFYNNDLKTLEYKDTAIQSIGVMFETQLGSVPEFPSLGVDEGLLVGGNRGVLKLPILQRQLLNLFATDDTFSSVVIDKTTVEQDSIDVVCRIQTVRGEEFSKTLNKS